MKKQVLYLFCLLIIGCSSPFTPKPKGYFKIDFPEKKYQTFNTAGYPYSFEYPTYAEVVKDSTFFGGATENPWWININFPQFNSKIYISYKEIGKNSFANLVTDAFKLTGKHAQKAYSIDDSAFATPNDVHGIYFNVGGEVATANQFFLTDSTKHFLRGALYFDATPNEDSLSIINRFIVEDVKHMINTFRWTNSSKK
jgi:gliding motility-associated lipoprotein GldD